MKLNVGVLEGEARDQEFKYSVAVFHITYLL